MSVAHWILPMPDLMVSSSPHKESTESQLYENGGAEGAKRGKQYSLQKNFGEIEIFWENRTVAIRAFGEDIRSPPLLSASFSFDELSGDKIMPGSIENIKSYQYSAKFMLDGSIIDGSETICVNHRGPPTFSHFILGSMGMSSLLIVFLVGPQLLLCWFILYRLRKAMHFGK